MADQIFTREHPEHGPDYYRQKAMSVRQGRYYRRVYGRDALLRLEQAYAEDVNHLCDQIETLAKLDREEKPRTRRRGEVRLEE